MSEEQSQRVRVDLLVFDRGPTGQDLLDSFAKMVKSDMIQPWECPGSARPVEIPNWGNIPAHRSVMWEDMNAEEPIDEWVQGQQDAPGFLVFLSYSNPLPGALSLLCWLRPPHDQPDTIGDITMESLAAQMGVDPTAAWDHDDLSQAVLFCLMDHPKASSMRDVIGQFHAQGQAIDLEGSTRQPGQSRTGPRL